MTSDKWAKTNSILNTNNSHQNENKVKNLLNMALLSKLTNIRLFPQSFSTSQKVCANVNIAIAWFFRPHTSNTDKNNRCFHIYRLLWCRSRLVWPCWQFLHTIWDDEKFRGPCVEPARLAADERETACVRPMVTIRRIECVHPFWSLIQCVSPSADIISLAGSKASARSISPGGSVVAFSDRLSLASGSLPAGVIEETSLSPQQLGVMGMEALETVINFWEDALVAYQTPTTAEESEFCREIQNLLDIAWQLQDQSELLFLDQRSVLFRAESVASEQRELQRSMSDPNFDSAESFASALDQVDQWYQQSFQLYWF